MKADDTLMEQGRLNLSAQTKRIIVLFGSLHGLVLLISIFPIEIPPHSTLLPVMKPYHELAGTNQDWNMFKTIPGARSISVKTKVYFPDGRVEETGAILPNMERGHFGESSRYFYMIQRIVREDRHAKYRDFWQAKIAEEIEREGARSFEVEVETQAIRHLFHIAKDGKLYKALFDRFGTYGVFRGNY